jgi:hypothetical protein
MLGIIQVDGGFLERRHHVPEPGYIRSDDVPQDRQRGVQPLALALSRASRRDLLGLPIQVQPDRDAERRGHLKREAQNGGRDGRPRVTSSSSVSACRRATRPADGTSPTTLPRFPDLLCAQDSAMLMAGSQDVLSPA